MVSSIFAATVPEVTDEIQQNLRINHFMGEICT
jgi:hypothetical protein